MSSRSRIGASVRCLRSVVAGVAVVLAGCTTRPPQVLSPRERKIRVHAALERMSIAHRARYRPQQLSGGQPPRVAIVRGVVALPKLVLADEPTGNPDSATSQEAMQLLAELNDDGTTIVVVRHSHPHAEYAHRIGNLFDGAIVKEKVRMAV